MLTRLIKMFSIKNLGAAHKMDRRGFGNRESNAGRQLSMKRNKPRDEPAGIRTGATKGRATALREVREWKLGCVCPNEKERTSKMQGGGKTAHLTCVQSPETIRCIDTDAELAGLGKKYGGTKITIKQ